MRGVLRAYGRRVGAGRDGPSGRQWRQRTGGWTMAVSAATCRGRVAYAVALQVSCVNCALTAVGLYRIVYSIRDDVAGYPSSE